MGLQSIVIIASVVGGYLLGSIPFGVIATRLGGLGDIRKVGSGNIGATNVLRTGRKDLALVTLLGDGGKGLVAVLVAWALVDGLEPDLAVICACLAGGAAFTGHLFPVWLKFKGGKGVATFLGVLLAIAFPAGLMACAAWVIMALVFRISSLSALTAAALSPVFILVAHQGSIAKVYLAIFMAVLVFIRHAENIRRLLKGEEPRIGAGKRA